MSRTFPLTASKLQSDLLPVMALHDEHTDILGGPILQRPETGLLAIFSQYHFVFKLFAFLGLGLLVCIACTRGLKHLKKHRELRYRKAMRRKHGIPDSDCRPFAVAYAAAKRAHLEREAQDRKKTTNYVSGHNPPAVDQRIDSPTVPHGLRRRVPETTVLLYDYQLSGKHASVCESKRPVVHSLNFDDRYNLGSRHRVPVQESLPIEQPPVRRTSRRNFIINLDDHEESRKRFFEEESDLEHETIKRSRIDGGEIIDGDEQADWYAQYSDVPSKESLDRQSADDYVHVDVQDRSKRVIGFHDEDHEPVDEAMEDIEEDEAAGFQAVTRGKKRDRAEAGSNFGVDDEEYIQNGSVPHCRKRRTTLRRTETAARGQKRNRGAGSPESEGEEGGPETSRRRAQRSPKKRGGKRAVSEEVNEMLNEGPHVSQDPLCGGRRVGDEWEFDGVQYKVGDKGERLRLMLVKKARNKYHMPQDSQHPDRSAALEIYVETWVTEAQYRQAERRQEPAWQEAPRESSRSKTPDVLDSPTKHGKTLLWDSVKGSPARRPFRQLMLAGASTRINPFEQCQLQPTLGRRVASSSTIVSPILPGAIDSPTRPGFRGFSKWEKQDREAEAMARIRAKIEEQKKTQAPPEKLVEVLTSTTVLELNTRSSPVPAITLTPVTAPAEAKSGERFSSSKPSASTFFVTPPSTGDSTKGAGVVTTPAPVAIPSTPFPRAPTAPTTTASTGSLSPFSFTKPPQVPLSASTIVSSSTVPNFFAKGNSTASPASSTHLPSALGAMTQSRPSSTENASKPASFSFAQPDISTSSSTAVSPPGTKPHVPNFGVSSGSSSMTFGPTLTASKVDGLTPLISTPASVSESSKPAVPHLLFPGASSSPSATIPPTPSASSLPKFSFGQSFTGSTSVPGFSFAPITTSQSKPTFKFGQTPPGTTDGASASTIPVADEPKKSIVSVSAFGSAAGSTESAKPSPVGTTSALGPSFSLPLASATNPFGKPATVDGASIPVPPKPTPASTSIPTFTNAPSSTPAGVAASGNTSIFSFGGTNSGPKPVDGSKPTSVFGGSSTEGKPIFTFGASAEGSKATSTPDGSTES